MPNTTAARAMERVCEQSVGGLIIMPLWSVSACLCTGIHIHVLPLHIWGIVCLGVLLVGCSICGVFCLILHGNHAPPHAAGNLGCGIAAISTARCTHGAHLTSYFCAKYPDLSLSLSLSLSLLPIPTEFPTENIT